MTLLEIIALLITLTALFSYLNFRFIKLPTTIGVMLMAMIFSLTLIGVGQVRPELARTAATWLQRFEFDDALLQGMLSFLLFAGALHINLDDLAKQKGLIAVLALGGVALSTFLFGTAIWYLLGRLGLELNYPW